MNERPLQSVCYKWLRGRRNRPVPLVKPPALLCEPTGTQARFRKEPTGCLCKTKRSYVRAYRNPSSVPQEPTHSLNKTTISHVCAYTNLNSVPQEPTGSFRQIHISHLLAYRNPISVPQEPTGSLRKTVVLASANRQEPKLGSAGTECFERQFYKFNHFYVPPRAPFIILNKARGALERSRRNHI